MKRYIWAAVACLLMGCCGTGHSISSSMRTPKWAAGLLCGQARGFICLAGSKDVDIAGICSVCTTPNRTCLFRCTASFKLWRKASVVQHYVNKRKTIAGIGVVSDSRLTE